MSTTDSLAAQSTSPAGPPGKRTVLVTGASGYIGGQLVPPLLEDFTVRVLTRSPDGVERQAWRDEVDVVVGDASRPEDLRRALDRVDVAYYLIHSMEADTTGFEERDRAAATLFAEEAERAGVQRLVYLGGLHPRDERLSPHLRSRVEIGRIFLDSSVPAACLQAAVILGDGSASFEMLRYLTSRLPAMVTPSWVDNPVQPIAAEDAIRCLRAAADLPSGVNRTFDIAGPDVLSYRQLMQTFAEATGRRRRLILPLPVLTPGLASLWVGLITPVDAALARPLVGSLIHPAVAHESDLDEYLGEPCQIGVDEAIRTAMRDARPDTGPRNLALCTAAVVATAAAGTAVTDPESQWYRRLDKPEWQPPKAAFPIAWTSLYALIAGTSAAHLTTLERQGRTEEATAYRTALGANLVLNAGWSALFFGLGRLPLASAEAILLTASSADLARRAGSTRPRRRRLLSPYAAWCAFATALTADITRRNRRKS